MLHGDDKTLRNTLELLQSDVRMPGQVPPKEKANRRLQRMSVHYPLDKKKSLVPFLKLIPFCFDCLHFLFALWVPLFIVEYAIERAKASKKIWIIHVKQTFDGPFLRGLEEPVKVLGTFDSAKVCRIGGKSKGVRDRQVSVGYMRGARDTCGRRIV